MVIQRWQSLLLLIAGVVMALFTFCSIGQFQLADYTCNFTTMGISIEGHQTANINTEVADTLYIFIISLVTVVLSLLAILLYKNTKLQKLLCAINSLVIVVVEANVLMLAYGKADQLPNFQPNWTIFIAPYVALVAIICAWRCIKNDEKKLRSYDRIR